MQSQFERTTLERSNFCRSNEVFSENESVTSLLGQKNKEKKLTEKNQIDGISSFKLVDKERACFEDINSCASISKSQATLSDNVYENLKPFASAIDKSQDKNNYYCPENIYENICHNCGRIYDDICSFCNDIPIHQDFSIKSNRNKHFLKKIFNKHFKSSSLKRSSSKIKKNEIFIVRDDGDTVFKTNCTFDFREMNCMRHNFLLNARNESNKKNEADIYENLPFYDTIDTTSVNYWIKSIIKCTEDYDNEIQYNIKAIPSKTFNETEWNTSTSINSKLRPLDQNVSETSCEFNEHIEKFIKSFKKTNLISLELENIENPERVRICWYEKNSDKSPKIQNSIKIGTANLFDMFNNSQRFITPLESKLTDNFDKCKQNTSILKTSEPAKEILLSIITNTTNNFYVFNNIRLQRAYNYLNKLLLSISLNTIVVSYDKRKITDNCGSSEVNTLLTWNNSYCFFEIHLIKKSKLVTKKIYSTPIQYQQLPAILSKNESFNALPPTIDHIAQQKHSSLQTNHKFFRTLTNMDSKSKTEVNNDIYYFIWNCDSKSETSMPRYDASPQEHQKCVMRDDQFWISAHEDFTSAGDLMDVVDISHRQFISKDSKESKYHDIRTYSDVLILYNENPLNNKIIYSQHNTSNPNTSKINENRMKSSGDSIILSANKRKKMLDFNLLEDSIKEFIKTIKNIEDEDELVRFLSIF